jgi:Na+/H+ antiporter NhaD/arsenite permease-like protein
VLCVGETGKKRNQVLLLTLFKNNQPMSIFVSTVVNLSSLPPNVKRAAMLRFGVLLFLGVFFSRLSSVALGSNFGANLSFVGALAGLMFVAILKPHNIEMRASYFSKAGFAVMPLVCFSAFLVLSVEATIEASWNNRTDNSSFPIRFDA